MLCSLLRCVGVRFPRHAIGSVTAASEKVSQAQPQVRDNSEANNITSRVPPASFPWKLIGHQIHRKMKEDRKRCLLEVGRMEEPDLRVEISAIQLLFMVIKMLTLVENKGR